MKTFNLADVIADARSLTNELTYSSYRYNRTLSPEISAERWEKVYGPSAKDMEVRFQKEGVQ